MSVSQQQLTNLGIWAGTGQWSADRGARADVAAEIEELGFGAVWLGSATPELELPAAILEATSSLVVVTGIVNIWTAEPPALAATANRLQQQFPDRFLLGLGSSHAPYVPSGQTYKPYSKLVGFLDELDAASPPVVGTDRILAALRPKTLRLAAERSAGAHPYNVPPEYTADARAELGKGPLLAVEQKVFLAADPEQARAVARDDLALYLSLPNYTELLRDYGLSDEDLTGDGSDKWVDTLVAWGDGDAVRGRVQAHLDAGANHVPLHVLSAAGSAALPLAEWREIAQLFGT